MVASDIQQNVVDSLSFEVNKLGGNLHSLVSMSTLASANYPCKIPTIIEKRIQDIGNVSEQALFIQQSRESILKMTSIMGTPKGINALTLLMSVVKSDTVLSNELAKLESPRKSSTYDYNGIRARGRELFASIYGRHTTIVEDKLHNLYPDLAEIIMVDSYGRLLSETKYLSARDTEMCAIGALVPQDVPAQLKSHCIGAKRLGATEEMVQVALRLAKMIITKRPMA